MLVIDKSNATKIKSGSIDRCDAQVMDFNNHVDVKTTIIRSSEEGKDKTTLEAMEKVKGMRINFYLGASIPQISSRIPSPTAAELKLSTLLRMTQNLRALT